MKQKLEKRPGTDAILKGVTLFEKVTICNIPQEGGKCK